jgi:crossover junction endodeoxyribonuclease RuvC
MTTRVLGIDPGLTRCGVGVVEVARDRTARLVHVSVIRTGPETPLEQRLLAVGTGIEELLDEHKPQAVAIERVFAQQNVRTVMGVAQISGVALLAAARRKLPVALHTPSEVKMAVTGFGSADKRQVQTMVAKILGMQEIPRPADAADALAIAICHAWRQPPAGGSADRGERSMTPAQEAWHAAEKRARTPVAARRLAR